MNLTGAFYTMQIAAQRMKSLGRGTMVVTASTNSFDGEPNLSAYNATKAGFLIPASTRQPVELRIRYGGCRMPGIDQNTAEMLRNSTAKSLAGSSPATFLLAAAARPRKWRTPWYSSLRIALLILPGPRFLSMAADGLQVRSMAPGKCGFRWRAMDEALAPPQHAAGVIQGRATGQSISSTSIALRRRIFVRTNSSISRP